MTPPIRMVSVPVALPLKLLDTLKPLAVVAEKLKHCHVVEVCEPTADNPSRNIIPMPREWFERTADDLEAIAILMHGAGVLSEGQAATLTGLDRVEVRKQVDALTAAPVREEGGASDWLHERFAADDSATFDLSEMVEAFNAGAQAALSTREEAPAEAGEVLDLLSHAKDAVHKIAALRSKIGPIASQAQTAGWAITLAMRHLRTQPQAREEAQPVAGDWQSVAMWMGFAASVIKSGEPWTEQCQREFDEAKAAFARLSSTPPAPEADKLRVAVEALEPFAAIAGHYLAGGMRADLDARAPSLLDLFNPRDFYRAHKALAALQQEGRDRG